MDCRFLWTALLDAYRERFCRPSPNPSSNRRRLHCRIHSDSLLLEHPNALKVKAFNAQMDCD